jgi:hypothetical protein
MILFYEDETHIRDYQALHTSWFLRGKQKQIPTYGRHASVTLFGAVNTQNGRLHLHAWRLRLVMQSIFGTFTICFT